MNIVYGLLGVIWVDQKEPFGVEFGLFGGGWVSGFLYWSLMADGETPWCMQPILTWIDSNECKDHDKVVWLPQNGLELTFVFENGKKVFSFSLFLSAVSWALKRILSLLVTLSVYLGGSGSGENLEKRSDLECCCKMRWKRSVYSFYLSTSCLPSSFVHEWG